MRFIMRLENDIHETMKSLMQLIIVQSFTREANKCLKYNEVNTRILSRLWFWNHILRDPEAFSKRDSKTSLKFGTSDRTLPEYLDTPKANSQSIV